MAGEIVEGTGAYLGYCKETSWAVPITAFTSVRKLPAASIGEGRTQLTTAELNTRRALTSVRLGAHTPAVSVPFELSYSGGHTAGSMQFDDFLESWMCADFTAAEAAMAAQNVIVGTPAATTLLTVTETGTLAVGQWIRLSGFLTTDLGNNGYYRISALVNDTSITIVTPNYATMVAHATPGHADVVIRRMAYVSPGTSVKSLAFEQTLTNTAATLVQVKMAIGCIANTFSLTINPDSIVTGAFEFMGRVLGQGDTRAAAATDVSVYSTVAAGASIVAADTNSVLTANDILAYITQDNTPVAVVTALTINGTNDIESLLPVGARYPYGLGKGNSVISGTMSIFLTDNSYWTKFRAETKFGLTVRLMDPDFGTTLTTQGAGMGYAFDLPNIQIMGLTETTDPKKVIQEVTWTAIELTPSANTKGAATTNMRVSRLDPA